MVILHYTGMVDAGAAIRRLTDPASRVSAHYTIDEEGTIYRHVAEEKRAWHAGVAYWRGDAAINARSIGIELVNPGHEFGYRPFPDDQINNLLRLLEEISARHKIAPHHFLAHSDVAPCRKQDPGELFPWQRLAACGFGLWPESWSDTDTPASCLENLAAIGYDPADGAASLLAFRRHWHPTWFDDHHDPETERRVAIIRRMMDDSPCQRLNT